MTPVERDELLTRLRASLGFVSPRMHKTIDSYTESLRMDLLDFLRNQDSRGVNLMAQAVKTERDEEFVAVIIEKYSSISSDVYSPDLLINILYNFRKHEWFRSLAADYDDETITLMLHNALKIMMTALYNWELPEMNEEASMDHGNLKYVERSLTGIVVWEFTDPRFVKLMLDHPEHTEQIEDLLVERGSISYEMLSAVLFNDSSAVSAGVL